MAVWAANASAREEMAFAWIDHISGCSILTRMICETQAEADGREEEGPWKRKYPRPTRHSIPRAIYAKPYNRELPDLSVGMG